MVDIVRTKRSTTSTAVPGAGTLPEGQLAVNLADKKIWIGDSANNPVEIYDSTLIPDHILNAHTDVNVPTPTDAYVLTWDNANQKWEAKPASGGLVEYGASVTPGGGDIWTDVNAFDWTGHQHAVGTALGIGANESVTFGNDTGISYRWVGPKDVTVGLGGNHVSVSADYLAISTGDHLVLANIGTNTHAQIDTHMAAPDAHHNAVTVFSQPIGDYLSLTADQQLNPAGIDLTKNILGNLPVTHLDSGTGAGSTTFWRGDGSWQVPAGGGDVSAVNSPLTTEYARWTGGTTLEGRTLAEAQADLSILTPTVHDTTDHDLDCGVFI